MAFCVACTIIMNQNCFYNHIFMYANTFAKTRNKINFDNDKTFTWDV